MVMFSQDLTEIDRKTYSGLEWLGDIGGLFDGLSYLGKIIIGPLATMALNAELLLHIFALEPNEDRKKRKIKFDLLEKELDIGKFFEN